MGGGKVRGQGLVSVCVRTSRVHIRPFGKALVCNFLALLRKHGDI